MKTILASTDFSPAAGNAVNYAARIAMAIQARLILFHVYHVPVTTVEGSVVAIPMEDLEETCMSDLQKTADALRMEYRNVLEVDCRCACGLAVDEISLFVKNNRVDLVVMGMQGSGYLGEKVMGSVTTTLIRNAPCPILVVDRSVEFGAIKRIIFACDYFRYEDLPMLKPLKEIIRHFGSHLFVLNVVRELSTMPSTPDEVADYNILDSGLKDVEHSFHYWPAEDAVDGINEFAGEKQADLIAMVPREHSFFHRLLHEPHTKKMAFHSHLPLLILTNNSITDRIDLNM